MVFCKAKMLPFGYASKAKVNKTVEELALANTKNLDFLCADRNQVLDQTTSVEEIASILGTGQAICSKVKM